MFTGLVQDVGKISGLVHSGGEIRLEISTALPAPVLGESIAVNGTCLSVTAVGNRSFSAFASSETTSRTTLGALKPGAAVNLERATRAGDPLGGHLVTGHIDAVVRLTRRERTGEAERWTIALPVEPALRRQIAPKGSVALDGVSLTVNEVAEAAFTSMIIPVTLRHTTLDGLAPGRELNLETDILAKYVARQLGADAPPAGGIDLELLARSGFVRR